MFYVIALAIWRVTKSVSPPGEKGTTRRIGLSGQVVWAATDKGSEVARLNAAYAASFSLDRVVMPMLRELVAATQESAAYHVAQADARLCLYRVDSPQPIRDHIKAGDVLPLDRGTGGRTLVAFGARTPTAPTAEDKNLYARIREQGYLSATGDRVAGLTGIPVPVFKADGTLAAALTLTMPAERYKESHVQKVLAVARTLSALLCT